MQNVMDYGAKGDRETDNTLAFQQALNAAALSGGGEVFAPPGAYLFTGHLAVPAGVTLRGSWAYPPASSPGMPSDYQNLGTRLLVTEGVNSPDGTPFLSLAAWSSLVGVSIQYPNQPAGSGPPVPYPFAVLADNANNLIQSVEIMNAYQGVRLAGGRHVVRDVMGQPLLTGISLDNSADIIRIENVHFNEYWHGDMKSWTRANGTAFRAARADDFRFLNCFAEQYATGWLFTVSAKGCAYGTLLGCSTDTCGRGLVCDGDPNYGSLLPGISVVGDSWWGDETAVQLTSTFRGQVCVSCAELGSVDVRGGALSLTGCRFPEGGPVAPNVTLHNGAGQFAQTGNLGVVIRRVP